MIDAAMMVIKNEDDEVGRLEGTKERIKTSLATSKNALATMNPDKESKIEIDDSPTSRGPSKATWKESTPTDLQIILFCKFNKQVNPICAFNVFETIVNLQLDPRKMREGTVRKTAVSMTLKTKVG
jgi:hypothetical protein